MQDVSYYIFTYRKGKIVRFLIYYSLLLLTFNTLLFFSPSMPLLRQMLITAPFITLFIVNLLKYIKSMAIDYFIQDGFLIIKNKRNGRIKEVSISDIKYIKHYFTYTRYSDRSHAYSKLIKVFTTDEIIEVYDTIQNSDGMILPEVLEKEFQINIKHVHDNKIIIFILLDFLLVILLDYYSIL